MGLTRTPITSAIIIFHITRNFRVVRISTLFQPAYVWPDSDGAYYGPARRKGEHAHRQRGLLLPVLAKNRSLTNCPNTLESFITRHGPIGPIRLNCRYSRLICLWNKWNHHWCSLLYFGFYKGEPISFTWLTSESIRSKSISAHLCKTQNKEVNHQWWVSFVSQTN